MIYYTRPQEKGGREGKQNDDNQNVKKRNERQHPNFKGLP